MLHLELNADALSLQQLFYPSAYQWLNKYWPFRLELFGR